MPRAILRSCAFALLLLLASSCSLTTMNDEVDSSRVEILSFTQTSATLSVGDTLRMVPHFASTSGGAIQGTPAVEYTSSNPAVATVEAKGTNYAMVITAVSTGTTTINASCCDDIEANITVTVRGAAWAFDSVSGSPTGIWQDAKGSASAALVFTPRDTVYEGESYNLIYKFIGTVMIVDGFSGRPAASISIGFSNRGLPAYSYDVPRNSGAMIPGTPLTDSISLSVTWPTIPIGASVVGVQMRGSFPTGAPPNAGLVVNAYYHKVTQ